MYIHLGQDTVVRADEIVGIFDLDTSTLAKSTREYLAAGERGGDVINVTDELPKSFVVCMDRAGRRSIYITQLSSATLWKRARPGRAYTAGQ